MKVELLRNCKSIVACLGKSPIDQATIPAANESPMSLFVKKVQPHLFGAEQEPETPQHHPPPLPPFPPN